MPAPPGSLQVSRCCSILSPLASLKPGILQEEAVFHQVGHYHDFPHLPTISH